MATKVLDHSERSKTSDDPEREVRKIAFWLSWGSLLPVIGWLRGAVMMWRSHLSTRDKLIGTALFPLGWTGALISVAYLASLSIRTCHAETYGVKGEAPSIVNEWCYNASALDPRVGGFLAFSVIVATFVGPVYIRSRSSRESL